MKMKNTTMNIKRSSIGVTGDGQANVLKHHYRPLQKPAQVAYANWLTNCLPDPHTNKQTDRGVDSSNKSEHLIALLHALRSVSKK